MNLLKSRTVLFACICVTLCFFIYTLFDSYRTLLQKNLAITYFYKRPKEPIVLAPLEAEDWTYTGIGDRLKNFLEGDELEEDVEDGEAWVEINNASILPPSARIIGKKIFHEKPLVIWATEWHMTPIKDVTNIVKDFGVHVKDYNLDPWRCAWHNCSAQKGLKVLNGNNVLNLDQKVEDAYIEAYKNSDEMKSVDVVYCGYPASLCQIYGKLNKSVFVQATTRYDVGRYTKERLDRLNSDYRELAKIPWNVFSGNNLYDSEFIKYYSGVNTYHIPSVCDYTGADYTGTTNKYFFLRRRDKGFVKVFHEEFKAFCDIVNCSVSLSKMEHYEYKQAAQYRGIVQVPYQVSVMSIFEQYRMNIPLFVPSPQLLTGWFIKHFMMHERTFEGAFAGRRMRHSVVPPHPSQSKVPDPKNEFAYHDNLYWLRLSDFYQAFPYCIVYESIPHLVHILQNITDKQLQEISAKMRAFNVEFKKQILRKFRAILLRFARNSPNNPH